MQIRQSISNNFSSGICKSPGSSSKDFSNSNETHALFSKKSRTDRDTVYINIYESELSNIVGQAVQAGFIEKPGASIGFVCARWQVCRGEYHGTVPGPNSAWRYSRLQKESRFIKRVFNCVF